MSLKKTLVLQIVVLGISFIAHCQDFSDYISYEIKQDSVWIETTNGKIFGLLFQPIGTKKNEIPAILCLQGGGDAGLDNYILEAKFFAKNGIAALICDKSGAGMSNTSKSWTQQSFKEKSAEYFEIHNWLSNYEGIDKSKVGIHGMSEGGRLAIYMAIEKPNNVAFVNSVSGPVVSFKENQLYAIYHHLLLQNNLDSSIIKEAIEVWDTYFEDIGNNKITRKTLKAIDNLIEIAPNLSYRPDVSGRLPLRPLSEDIHFTVEGDLQNIACPLLFQYGELDTRVDPIKSLSVIPNKSNFTIKTYKDTDHSMNLKNGKMNPFYIEDKLDWIQRDVLNLK